VEKKVFFFPLFSSKTENTTIYRQKKGYIEEKEKKLEIVVIVK